MYLVNATAIERQPTPCQCVHTAACMSVIFTEAEVTRCQPLTTGSNSTGEAH